MRVLEAVLNGGFLPSERDPQILLVHETSEVMETSGKYFQSCSSLRKRRRPFGERETQRPTCAVQGRRPGKDWLEDRRTSSPWNWAGVSAAPPQAPLKLCWLSRKAEHASPRPKSEE